MPQPLNPLVFRGNLEEIKKMSATRPGFTLGAPFRSSELLRWGWQGVPGADEVPLEGQAGFKKLQAPLHCLKLR